MVELMKEGWSGGIHQGGMEWWNSSRGNGVVELMKEGWSGGIHQGGIEWWN